MYVDDILSVAQFSDVSVADLDRVVNNNDKQRFQMQPHPTNGRMIIRATQGHSVKVSGVAVNMCFVVAFTTISVLRWTAWDFGRSRVRLNFL